MIFPPEEVPARVDFAGGWFDVPAFAGADRLIVNCAISPLFQKDGTPYLPSGGVGGSAAMSVLKGEDAVDVELQTAGWQDPAVILETGLCVWQSGPRPKLLLKTSGDVLKGRMALEWAGYPHTSSTKQVCDGMHAENGPGHINKRAQAARIAARGVSHNDFADICCGIRWSYQIQQAEGMQEIDDRASGAVYKYCGAGFGGYIVHLFQGSGDRDAFVELDPDKRMVVEPYLRKPWA